MTPERDESSDRLRRSLRDLIALTALQPVWARYNPQQIATDMVDVVFRTVDPDAVSLCIQAGQPIDILRTRNPDGNVEQLLRAFPPPLTSEPQTRRLPDGREIQIVSLSLSSDSSDRIIAASFRTDFPSEMERLLMRVAANQAWTWIQRKNAETALASETELRRAIEESMLAGVATVDPQGRQTYVNSAFCRMVGWEAEELIGAQPPFVYWPPEEHATILAALSEVISGHLSPEGYELRFRRKNEERFDALVLISPLLHEGGGFLASVHDVTERKKTERATALLAEAGEILSRSLDYEETLQAISRLVVPRVADWCFIDLVESDGSFQRIAVGHARPEDAPLAARLRRRYDARSAPFSVSRTFRGGQTVMMNEVPDELLRSVARDADHLDALQSMGVQCFLSVPMTSRGATFGVLSLIGSHTRRRFEPSDAALAEEVARRASLAVDNARLYRNAQEANRAKDEFLANLSHELRTPMTAILGWAHLLQMGGLPAEDTRIGVETIRQSSEMQARLIDDLLDVSRIVTGKLFLNTQPMLLGPSVRAAASAIRPAAAARRQQLAVEIDDEDLTVLGDAGRLQQVFWNLLSNATKFTPPGGSIDVRVRSDSPGTVSVTVTDTGEGIPAELLPMIFERFRQGVGANRPRPGLGLGLAIAKELVEMHGGSISASSEGAGKGSSFLIVLPRYEARADEQLSPASEGAAERPLHGVRVLLVEDDEATRTLLATMLRSFGATVRSAATAAEARSLAESSRPQVLVSDLDLSGEDGIGLLRAVRESTHSLLPAIALTGLCDPDTRRRAAAAGFNGFLSKPIDPAALVQELVTSLEKS